MNPQKFGDSYDFVKREIIRGLAPADEWAVHPMYFAQCPDMDFLKQYKRFLGIGLVKGWDKPRREVCSVGQRCQKHLLLDPDTGLRIPGPRERGHGQHRREYLNVAELAEIAAATGRKHRLTLVYDQSYPRNITLDNRMQRVQEKLTMLRDFDLYGVSYVSHVAFVWVSADQDTVIAATNRLINSSRLPRWRFVGEGV